MKNSSSQRTEERTEVRKEVSFLGDNTYQGKAYVTQVLEYD
jgi:hypothetical protein